MISGSLPKISQYLLSEIYHFATKVRANTSYTLEHLSTQNFCVLMYVEEFKSLVYVEENSPVSLF